MTAKGQTVDAISSRRSGRRALLALLTGVPIGVLGGLIGLGGAEFRLPLLKTVFRYESRRAVTINLCISLVTVCAALLVRLQALPFADLRPLWSPVAALATGAVAGAWIGSAVASAMTVARLERLIFILLDGLGTCLVVETFLPLRGSGLQAGISGRFAAGVLLGIGIGWISSVLGVAGGELLIPTLVFVFGAGVKVAGTGSLLVSVPALCVGVGRYARCIAPRPPRSDKHGPSHGRRIRVGALAGGLLVPFVPAAGLKAALGLILLISAYKSFAR